MPPSPSLFKRVFLPALLLFALAGFAVRLAVDRDFRGWFDTDFLQAWWRVGYVMNVAHQQYLHPEKVTYDQLGEQALSHELDGLDRYTTYLSPADFANFTNESDQQIVGVGVEIEKWQGRVQVTHIFPGSPADQALWQVGDRIVDIDGTDTRDFNVSQVSERLRGTANTHVKVTLERPGTADLPPSILTREPFEVPSVRDDFPHLEGIAYLRLTEFGRHTAEEFSQQLRALDTPNISGLVLDLRDNPGGLLNSTPEVLKTLLKPGQLVTSTKGRYDDGDEWRVPAARSGDEHFSGPVVVLVNEDTASAAEIVAGALQDTRRAVIVGVRTYGKGIVQTVSEMPGGGGLRLTTEAYYLPSGRTINEKGVVPDVIVPLSQAQSDLLRLQRADLRRLSPAEFTQYYGFAPVPDPQLETAVALLRSTDVHPYLNLPSAATPP